jgi:hypothetical protein
MRVDCPAISCRHRHRSCTACGEVAPPSSISDLAAPPSLIHLLDHWFGADHLEGRIIYVVSMNVLLASIPVATLTLPLALTKQQGRPSLSMCDSYQPCLDLLSSQNFEDALMIISGAKM